jgi:hypothetical protein
MGANRAQFYQEAFQQSTTTLQASGIGIRLVGEINFTDKRCAQVTK